MGTRTPFEPRTRRIAFRRDGHGRIVGTGPEDPAAFLRDPEVRALFAAKDRARRRGAALEHGIPREAVEAYLDDEERRAGEAERARIARFWARRGSR